MNAASRDQNESLIKITIQMDKDISGLEEILNKQGEKAGPELIEAINCLYDAKRDIEHHAVVIRTAKTGTCSHHDAYVD